MPDRFDKAAAEWKPQIVALVAHLITTIADDYRASDDPSDETPGMQITIATDDELSAWTYQTGDNSFSGSCYGFPHWGVGAVYRDSEPGAVADDLLRDLGEQWASNPDNTEPPEGEPEESEPEAPADCDTCGASAEEQRPCLCAQVEAGAIVGYTAPSHWASYLINGDASGLEDSEEREADAWLASLADSVEPGGPVDCRDAGFCRRPDSGGLAADCQTYYFYPKRDAVSSESAKPA